jgi:flagellar motor switch/type III secretory pathway protein FliN
VLVRAACHPIQLREFGPGPDVCADKHDFRGFERRSTMQRRVITIGVVACVLALVIGGVSFAQGGGQGGGQGGRQRGQGDQGGGQRGGGQFDPAQMAEMRQRMAERMKERLGVDDEAWKVLEPRLTKVQELSRQQMMAGGRGMMAFGGQRGGARGGEQGGPQGQRPRFPGQENREPTAVEKETEALNTVLENPSASAEQIKQRLTALRAAREKARTELATARQDLRQLLTMRQEAILVLDGTLD